MLLRTWSTPLTLLASKSSVENIVVEDSSNEVVKMLEKKITELKEEKKWRNGSDEAKLRGFAIRITQNETIHAKVCS